MSKKLRNRLRARQRRVQRTLELYQLYDNRCQHCYMESYDVGFFDFHHIDPDEKEDNVGSLLNKSMDKAKEEADKCLMLCPNCHRNEHIRIREEEYIDVYEEVDQRY